jgi:hypothetical protein
VPVTTAIGECARAVDLQPVTPPDRLARLLDEFASLLHVTPPAVYAAAEGGQTAIARHIEECLDLIETLVSARSKRAVVYAPPPPQRITAADIATSLRRIGRIQKQLVDWPRRTLDAGTRVEHQADAFGCDEPSWSTLGNELAFIINRVVDRQKLIDRALKAYGVSAPGGFGSMELQPLRARASVPPAWELWRLLDELDSVLTEVPPDVYCARFASDVSGSIGEHVRHCLDHVSALLSADASATLSYERRQRGTAVETVPAQAVRQILQLKRGIEMWATRSLDEPIRVTSMISPAGDAVTGWSTLARELAFVLSHTIHHQAIIGLLLTVHGHEVPDRFGHSPSTPARN